VQALEVRWWIQLVPFYPLSESQDEAYYLKAMAYNHLGKFDEREEATALSSCVFNRPPWEEMIDVYIL
jgi:hypothetical protein